MAKTQYESMKESGFPMALLDRAIIESMMASHQRASDPPDGTWEDFDPLKTAWRPELYLRASTYAPMPKEVYQDIPVAHLNGLKFGKWMLCNQPLPKGTRLRTYHGKNHPNIKRGWVQFDDTVLITSLNRRIVWNPNGWDTIMGLSPNELLSMKGGIRAARGEVVITGLGLGYLMMQVCNKPGVTKVTVVELDPDIVEMIGPRVTPFCRVKPRIVVGDANEDLARHGGDVLLADHFDDFGSNSDWLSYMPEAYRRKLATNFGRIWIWA